MKIPRDLSGSEVLKALGRRGFIVARQSGSHVRLVKANKRVTVPLHRSLKVGALQNPAPQRSIRLANVVRNILAIKNINPRVG